MLELRHVTKLYSGIPVVSNVNFIARAGEVTGYRDQLRGLSAPPLAEKVGGFLTLGLPTLEDIFSQLAVEQGTAGVTRDLAALVEL